MSGLKDTEPLAPEDTARLIEFARACKAAARAVLLYPAAHPAIAATLALRAFSKERRITRVRGS